MDLVRTSTSTIVARAQQAASLGPATHPDDAALLALACARPDLAWPTGRDIAVARNAHLTNTRQELVDALRSESDWLEGDVGMHDGQPVMRHAPGDAVDLTLERWLRIVATSGRGAKLDLKDADALPSMLRAIRAADIPEHRLIINVEVLPVEQLRSIRRAFPKAIVNLSPVADADLTDMELVALQSAADVVRGNLMFPIRIDLMSADVVRALRPFGRIAVWNEPRLWNPSPNDTACLRAMGVNGMVDLREPRGLAARAQAAIAGTAVKLFGWDAVHRALEAIGYLRAARDSGSDGRSAISSWR